MYLTLSIFSFIIFGFCVLIRKAFSTVRCTQVFLTDLLWLKYFTFKSLNHLNFAGGGEGRREVYKE